MTAIRARVLPVLLGIALSLLGPVQSLDERVQEALQRTRDPGLDRIVSTATGIARPPVVLALVLGLGVLGGPAGRATARQAVLALVPTNLVVEGLKRGVKRARPDGERRRSNASFPSSHAANAFALATVLSRRWRRLSVPFWLLAAGVGWSRMYLNRHFLSDVLCGAVIGVTCAWYVGHVLRGRWAAAGPEVAGPVGEG